MTITTLIDGDTKVRVASAETTEQEHAARMARAKKIDEEMDEKDDQIEELQKQLAVAEGKVQVLQGLLGQQLSRQ